MLSVLHLAVDDAEARRIVQELMTTCVPGSFLVTSHPARDIDAEQTAEDWQAGSGMPEDRAGDAAMAVHELAANAVRRGAKAAADVDPRRGAALPGRGAASAAACRGGGPGPGGHA